MQHGLDALPGMTILSACLEAVSYKYFFHPLLMFTIELFYSFIRISVKAWWFAENQTRCLDHRATD